MKRNKFAIAEKIELTEDDRFVLDLIYQSRSRTFLAVFGAISAIVVLIAVIRLIDYDVLNLVAGLTTLLVLVILPGAFIFLSRVWIYKRDLKAGFKYKINQQITGKQYFPHTDQYFISLDDREYLHHEVEREEFESLEAGDSYPVFFAAHSHYPFTMRTRITMM